MDNRLKAWIDDADYTELSRRWKDAHESDPIFQGDVRGYYIRVMRMKKGKIQLIGGPKKGLKIFDNGSFAVFQIKGRQAVYKKAYNRGQLYYMWVGWDTPKFVNCFIVE